MKPPNGDAGPASLWQLIQNTLGSKNQPLESVADRPRLKVASGEAQFFGQA
jgi:hypothetical protein